MKTLDIAKIAAIALVASIALPASANISTGKLAQDVYSAVGSAGQVNVSVNDGVATLSGYTNNKSEALKAVNAALAHNGVDRVVNLISAY